MQLDMIKLLQEYDYIASKLKGDILTFSDEEYGEHKPYIEYFERQDYIKDLDIDNGYCYMTTSSFPYFKEHIKDEIPNIISLYLMIPEIQKNFKTNFIQGFPSVPHIYDDDNFIEWKENVKFELSKLKQEILILETINILNSFDGWNDEQSFKELAIKLKIICDNYNEYLIKDDESKNNTDDVNQCNSKEPKLFISHSSKDVKYVEQIVDLLVYIGMPNDKIFCSSVPGYGIPIDGDIFEFLKEQFEKFSLHVLFIHSENYYKSPISLNEMGAAWILHTNYTSILLPEFPITNMRGVVTNKNIVINFDDINELFIKDKLNQLKDVLSDEFNFTPISGIKWESKRDDFIEKIKSIKAELKDDTESNLDNDLELTEKGYYIKKSDKENGKDIRYCASCYNDTGKLYPYTQGSMNRDLFCSRCKNHIIK